MSTVNKTSEIIEHFKNLGLTEVPSSEVYKYAAIHNLKGSQYKELFGPRYKIKRGLISLSPLGGGRVASVDTATQKPILAPLPKFTPAPRPVVTMTMAATESVEPIFIPQKDPTYVPWGAFADIRCALQTGMFYPIFISGLSGNGKTLMVEQVCASLKREYVRVQISKNTDEEDLIGGFRLVNGETQFFKGPVVRAYESGAVLLLDEVDRGNNSLLCMQGILEGKPILLKKTMELVHPRPGFTVIATANTKGRGSDDGRYSGALVIDDAFLERFVATIDQEYPTASVEKKIVLNHMEKYGCNDDTFADFLITWAQSIRKTFMAGGLDEFISTRRLCHIVQSYSIFRDRKKAIAVCVSRYDANTRDAFIELFDKITPETVVSMEAPL
jgi:hypothetical protein